MNKKVIIISVVVALVIAIVLFVIKYKNEIKDKMGLSGMDEKEDKLLDPATDFIGGNTSNPMADPYNTGIVMQDDFSDVA